jgi:AcrR family transcriptional regulator
LFLVQDSTRMQYLPSAKGRTRVAAARRAKGKGKRKTATGVAPGEVGVPSALEDLAPTARQLLEAARRLLETQDYSSLTLKAIGREAGQNESLIGYHFGSKTGLMVALVDWLLYDTLRDLQARVAQLNEGQDQLHLAVDDSRKLATDVDSYRAFFDLLPHLIETREGRQRMADLYRGYREMNARALCSTSTEARTPQARALGAMHIAFTDGLAIQVALDPGGIDVQLVAELWEDFVRHARGQGEAGADDSSA